MKFNPEMVFLAREYRVLTQEDLGRKTGFSQPKIARIESGVGSDLDPEDAHRLAKELEFPLDFFQQDEVRVGFGSSSYFYRKRTSLSSADRKRIQSIVNLFRIHLKRMLSAVDMEYTRPFRRMEIEDYGGIPSGVARALRAYWKLPDGPVGDLTGAAEAAGILIIPCNFGTREIDGTSLWLGELPPMVFIRRDLPGDRWRFTLAHEVGHLLMHELPTETMEREADQFAAELLMPEKSIRPQLARFQSITLADLANMKLYWKVAMQAVLRRSLDLGCTTENHARYIYQRMSSAGQRMVEPIEIEREAATVVEKLVTCFIEQMGYTADALASFLRIAKNDVELLYGIKFKPERAERPRLRLVT
jgi:Zn-dependent peptidase ImmA (M78 family)/transcriptional regulator with XRE-family HTH domain